MQFNSCCNKAKECVKNTKNMQTLDIAIILKLCYHSNSLSKFHLSTVITFSKAS